MTAYREGGSEARAPISRVAFTTHPRAFALFVVALLAALAGVGRLILDHHYEGAVIVGLLAAVLFHHADKARTVYERNGAYLDIRRGLSRLRTQRLHVDTGAEVTVVAAAKPAGEEEDARKTRNMTVIMLVEVATAGGTRVIAETEDDKTADALAAAVRTVVGPSQPG